MLVSAPSLSLPRGCLTRSPFIHSGNTHSSPKPLRGVRAHRHLDIHSAPPISRTISLDSRVSYSGTPLSVASSPRSIASFGETSHDPQPPNFNATNTNHIPVSAQSSFDRAPSPLDLFQSDDFVFGTIQYPGSSLCGHSPPTQFI